MTILYGIERSASQNTKYAHAALFSSRQHQVNELSHLRVSYRAGFTRGHHNATRLGLGNL